MTKVCKRLRWKLCKNTPLNQEIESVQLQSRYTDWLKYHGTRKEHGTQLDLKADLQRALENENVVKTTKHEEERPIVMQQIVAPSERETWLKEMHREFATMLVANGITHHDLEDLNKWAIFENPQLSVKEYCPAFEKKYKSLKYLLERAWKNAEDAGIQRIGRTVLE